MHQGLDGSAGGHLSEKRNLGRGGCASRRENLDGSALVVGALDVPLALEIGEVLVHGGQGLKAELFRDLLEAGRVPLLLDVSVQIAEDFALALGQGHWVLSALGEKTTE